jgi:hypothetical protein
MALAEIIPADDKTLPLEDGEMEGDLLDVDDLVRMFEESEEATWEARQQAERDRDYYDGKQLTEEERAVLRKRRQPEVIINRIRRKVEFLVGFEKQQKVQPKAMPTEPMHEEDAAGVTDVLEYVTRDQAYSRKRSAVWRNLLLEGVGGIGVRAEGRGQQAALEGAASDLADQDHRREGGVQGPE